MLNAQCSLLDGLASLVDKSLLYQVDSAEPDLPLAGLGNRAVEGGEPRFMMLETIREYALERLLASGEQEAIRHTHAQFFLELAEAAAAALEGNEQGRWLKRLQQEHDNLRAALAYLVSTGYAEWGLRLGYALFKFWQWREHFTEGRKWLTAILALPAAAAPTQLRGRVVYYAGVLTEVQNEHATAARLLREAEGLARAVGDTVGEATAKSALAWQLVQVAGNHAEAHSLLEDAAALWERLGASVMADQARSNIANVAKAAGNLPLARTLLEQLVTTSAERGDAHSLAAALGALGDVAAKAGDPIEARRFHQESLARFQQIDDRVGVARALADLADLDRAHGDAAVAVRSSVEALRAFHRAGLQRGMARQLEALAAAGSGSSRHDAAVSLVSAAATIRQRLRVPSDPTERPIIERTLADARRHLSSHDYERAWTEGAGETLDRLVALVVDN